MKTLLLRARDVAQACPMEDAIEAVEQGFRALSTGQATTPVRLSVPINMEGVALTMPASLTGAPWYSVKVVSVAPANRSIGRPLVTATVLLLDASSGDLVALIEGAALTALRTGAAGGVHPGMRPRSVVRNQRSCCISTSRVFHLGRGRRD